MDGAVDMHCRQEGMKHVVRLEAGDVFFADVGCEHVVQPLSAARILVVEKVGAVQPKQLPSSFHEPSLSHSLTRWPLRPKLPRSNCGKGPPCKLF